MGRTAASTQEGHPRQGPFTVSVLLPNYNHAAFLARQLEAICAQTRAPTEVLVLDDGSSDDSVAVVLDFARRHPFVRLLQNERNRGLPNSINRLLAEATGDFVVSAAADDLLLPRFLEASLERLERYPEAGVCVSEFVVMESDGTIRNYARENPRSFGLDTLPDHATPEAFQASFRDRYVWISTNTCVTRRSLLVEAGGFPAALEWHGDWFAIYAIALRHGVCVVREGLAVLRSNVGGYSEAGMKDPVRQGRVLRAIAAQLKQPENRDLLAVVRRFPALLDVFGRELVFALRTKPRHWDLLLSWVRHAIRRERRDRKTSWAALLFADLLRGGILTRRGSAAARRLEPFLRSVLRRRRAGEIAQKRILGGQE